MSAAEPGWFEGLVASLIAIGGGVVAWRKGSSRDSVDAAKDRAEINIVGTLERRANEAEAEADRERAERLKTERALVQAEAKLYIAAQDIVRLDRRLEKAGVPHSDYGHLIETNFGTLPDEPQEPKS
jgi:hypothetical protein